MIIPETRKTVNDESLKWILRLLAAEVKGMVKNETESEN